jgi:hypothetical protein
MIPLAKSFRPPASSAPEKPPPATTNVSIARRHPRSGSESEFVSLIRVKETVEVLPSPAACSTPQADWVRWSLAVRRSPTIMTFQSHRSRPSHDFGLGGGLRFTCSFRSRLSPGQGQSRQYHYRPTPTKESSAKSGADNHMDNKPSSVEHYVREVWKSLRTRLQKRCASRGYHPVCRARSLECQLKVNVTLVHLIAGVADDMFAHVRANFGACQSRYKAVSWGMKS